MSAISKYVESLWSFDGRITRCEWWLGMLVTYAAFGLSTVPMVIHDAFVILPIVMGLLTTWWALTLHAKRWHDHNNSGWWTLVMFVPFLGAILTLLVLGCLKGTEGPNKYGLSRYEPKAEACT